MLAPRPNSLVKAFRVVSDEVISYEREVYFKTVDGIEVVCMTPLDMAFIESPRDTSRVIQSLRNNVWTRVMQGINR